MGGGGGDLNPPEMEVLLNCDDNWDTDDGDGDEDFGGAVSTATGTTTGALLVKFGL